MERVWLERKVLSENDRLAAALRERFAEHNILCLNLISSPGSGKTSLLERTLENFDSGERVAVLTGDIQTENDAKRLARSGFPVKQITTGGTCHLDAAMIDRALQDWHLEDIDLLLIENVGNLVCPAIYDLGQALNVVALSVTEGEDKPLKYPVIFRNADAVLLTKIDLLPHLGVSIRNFDDAIARVMPQPRVFPVSARTGEGLDRWLQWLDEKRIRADL